MYADKIKQLDAIYKNGTFMPFSNLNLIDGQYVKISVEIIDKKKSIEGDSLIAGMRGKATNEFTTDEIMQITRGE